MWQPIEEASTDCDLTPRRDKGGQHSRSDVVDVILVSAPDHNQDRASAVQLWVGYIAKLPRNSNPTRNVELNQSGRIVF
jgi:hypothetical protein